MLNPIEWLFYTGDWPARWDCGVWPAWLGWGTVAGNLMYAVSYVVIPFTGWRLLRKKKELVPDIKLGWWGLTFVLLCGLSHFWDAAMFWYPAYRINGLFRLAGGGVSVYFVCLLIRREKTLLSYVGPDEAVRRFKECKKVKRDLEAARDRLKEELSKKAEHARKLEEILNEHHVVGERRLDRRKVFALWEDMAHDLAGDGGRSSSSHRPLPPGAGS